MLAVAPSLEVITELVYWELTGQSHSWSTLKMSWSRSGPHCFHEQSVVSLWELRCHSFLGASSFPKEADFKIFW